MTETVVKPSPPLSYTQKLSLIAGSATVLYFLPSEAQAADIRYTDTNPVTITFADIGSNVRWDVDGDGNDDFNLSAGTTTFLGVGKTFIQLTSNSLSGRGFVNAVGDNPEDIRWLQTNLLITNNVGAIFPLDYVWGGTNVANRTVLSFNNGNFFEPNVKPSTQSSGFIGFRFLGSDNEIHYGWAEMTLNADAGTPSNSSVTIRRWAYNAVGCGAGVPLNSDCTNSDSGIRPGDTGNGGTPTVPEPTSPLALLALGAAGVYRWRKERQENEN